MLSAQLMFSALQDSALSVSLRASEWVYPLVNTLHILGIALLIGPILVLDWRLLRPRASPGVATLAALLLPAARGGFALAVVTGGLLFVARPLDYAFNGLFQLKLGSIGLALLNILALHRSRAWDLAITHDHPGRPVLLACAVSMVCWLAALALGRLIGYR